MLMNNEALRVRGLIKTINVGKERCVNMPVFCNSHTKSLK
jgi:hypothetical protein